MTKEKVLELLNQQRAKIREFGVKRIGLFGSFVRDEQTEESDIDILVEFDPGAKNFDNFIHLVFFLEDLFRREVELITPESMNQFVKARIVKEVKYVPIAA